MKLEFIQDFRLNTRSKLASLIPSAPISDALYSYANFKMASDLPFVCTFSHDNRVSILFIITDALSTSP